jgi:hypothetical protein
LTVTLLPAGAVSAGAQWQINGGAALNSGVTVTNLPEGSYTVSFTAIPGWDTPSNQVITVTNGALTTLTAVYTPSLATITAVANPMSGGVVSGAGSFVVGSQVQILATASNGWVFSSWNDGDTQNPRIVTVPSGGATYAANFTFVPIRASYYGLFYDTNDIAFQSSGYFSLAMTAKGTFSATLLTAGKVYPFSGSFSTTGSASNSVSVSKAERLTVMLGFDSGGLDVLTGEITDGNWTAQLVANREVFSATNPAPQAGKYTVLIPGSRDAAVQPGGYGFGTVTVDPLGNLKFSGTLGDGTAVSQTAVVSEEGKWPLYDSPYSGNGSIIGWLTFTNQPASDIMGTVTWTKLPRPTAKYYSAGFTNQTDAVGSLFQFTNGIPVLDFAAGELWLTNGNLSQSFTNWFTLGGNNKVTSTNKMSLTIATSSGLFTGSIVNPATKKSISIHGAVLQKQSLGAGYFLGTNESGGVLLGVAP